MQHSSKLHISHNLNITLPNLRTTVQHSFFTKLSNNFQEQKLTSLQHFTQLVNTSQNFKKPYKTVKRNTNLYNIIFTNAVQQLHKKQSCI
jgi:hypothetical protein